MPSQRLAQRRLPEVDTKHRADKSVGRLPNTEIPEFGRTFEAGMDQFRTVIYANWWLEHQRNASSMSMYLMRSSRIVTVSSGFAIQTVQPDSLALKSLDPTDAN